MRDDKKSTTDRFPSSIFESTAAEGFSLLETVRARETVFENDWNVGGRRNLHAFVQTDLKNCPAIRRLDRGCAVAHGIAQRIRDWAAMIRIERLNTMQ